nr:hypothetical protein [Methanobrevibacter arboriphilus]
MKRTVHLTGEQRKQIAIDVLSEIIGMKLDEIDNMTKVRDELNYRLVEDVEIREISGEITYAYPKRKY